MVDFVHLHVHSQFSFLSSTAKLTDLVLTAREHGMTALSLTDHANMFGAVRFYKECLKQGLAPILGCELNVARPEGGDKVDHLVVLAKNEEGYRNLVRLVSESYTNPATEHTPGVRLDSIAESSRGLVGLTGCLNGVLPQRILEFGPDSAEPGLADLRDRFEPGHLFVELQDHGLPEQPVLSDLLTRAARRLGLPVVATNDVHFVRRDDGEALVYLDAIRLGKTYEAERANHHGSFEMYLKTPEEMVQSFRGPPEALSNTARVAELCSGLKLEFGRVMLPQFPVPPGYDAASYLCSLARQGLADRLQELALAKQSVDRAVYEQRLERELGVIVSMHYAGYFLIVWDFIREAKVRGIPVGPGRGSGAGSLVAHSLGITELDPIAYGLLFERFLNPERVSMPDFDVDFCMARRDEVIHYVAGKYGKESVGQIATFQNLKARSVIKDVARVMGISATEGQRIASLVPDLGQGKTATIEEALAQEPRLKNLAESDARIATLIRQAKKLEGLTRHAGMHAAGVVISDGPLYDHVPCFTSDSAIVTQYDKDDVEAAGLVKFDFLGLKTLTVIAIAERLVQARPDRRNAPLELNRIPLDDRQTYQLIGTGETTGVFQLESSGMQQLLKQLRPDCFEDIVAAVALYRPGPLGTGMIDDFVDRKHKKKPVPRLHPLVDGVLAPTYGVPVYQEQVMQIAQGLAGYTLGSADLLRRAMGKKKAEEMAMQQEIFVAGAVHNGVSPEQATSIFRQIEGFASYGFNKSHSAAYALITYQTAYLKAHYPTEFFAALLTADKDKIDKVVRTVAEARAWGVTVLPPDINQSDVDFTVDYAFPDGQGTPRGPGRLRDCHGPRLRFGLGAVRGVGESALDTVFEARRAGGPFRDLFDFSARIEGKRLNRGVLEALVQCGAFDSVLEPAGIHRARALAAVDQALERSRSLSRDRERGQTNLFGKLMPAQGTSGNLPSVDEYPPATAWDRLELLRREKSALGCYVTGHPLLRYGPSLGRLGAVPSVKLAAEKAWSEVAVAGMVENYRERLFKGGGGNKVAFFELDDSHGRVECKLRGERIGACAELLTRGEPVLVSGTLAFPQTEDAEEERQPTVLVNKVEPLAERLLSITRSVTIRLCAEKVSRGDLEALRDLLRSEPGTCPVEFSVELPDGASAILTPDEYRVTPSEGLLGGLERLFGASVAELM
jgi:DNA polymerase-3 subunit alpha